jgi:hypothetical protein
MVRCTDCRRGAERRGAFCCRRDVWDLGGAKETCEFSIVTHGNNTGVGEDWYVVGVEPKRSYMSWMEEDDAEEAAEAAAERLLRPRRPGRILRTPRWCRPRRPGRILRTPRWCR